MPDLHVLAAEEVSWLWTAAGLLSIPLLVGLNGLFVAAEFALVGVRATRVDEMVRQDLRGAASVESAVANLDRSIAATQLGITLASIALGWLGEPAMAGLIKPVFARLPSALSFMATHSVATGLAFCAITYMHVVFGELIPKTVALQKPDDTALRIATPLAMFAKVMRPFLVVMNQTGNAILRWCGYRAATELEMAHSVEELASLVKGSRDVGILGRTQAEVVRKTFRLSTKRVQDCMVPRDKCDVLELTTHPEQVLRSLRESAHTRMPVYQGTVDNVVGIVNTKDLFNVFSLKGTVILEDALYPPAFLKPDDEIFVALQVFRKSHRPMAIVQGDDGCFLGLITLEDVVEQIVGDIEDEHDDPTARKVRADWMEKKGPSR